MNKKKLTDEEIVKALDFCYTSPCCSCECPYFNKHGRNFCMEDKALYKNLKDFIQRLQAEIEKLRNAKVITETVDYCYEDLKNAQAEIERLSKKAVALEVETNNQKAEIERLKEYNLNLNGMNLEFIDKNAELQKQVDELKKELEVANGTKKRLTIFDRIEIHDKAVKDTAKKFADLVEFHSVATRDENGFEMFSISALGLKEILREDFGVEVE